MSDIEWVRARDRSPSGKLSRCASMSSPALFESGREPFDSLRSMALVVPASRRSRRDFPQHSLPIVHTDDFASADNPIDWWPRLLEQVAEPLAAGKGARYQRYDWATESLAEWIDLEPAPVVIIEGVTAARQQWRHHLSFIIWIETPCPERLRRGLERDGADALGDWEAWGAAEDTHYDHDPIRQHTALVVDGTGPMDQETFTVANLARGA